MVLVGLRSTVWGSRSLTSVCRYRQDSDRTSFVVAAALLRLVAGKELGRSPALVPVHRRCARCGRPHGRPKIVDAEFSVSVAHSAQRVMLGLTTDGTVGVDVEQVRAIDVDALGPTVLSTAELPTTQTLNEFFTTWVRKEAVLKALGTGLETPMSSLTLSPADAAPRLVAMAGGTHQELLLADVDAGPGYAAAVANARDLQRTGAVEAAQPGVTVRVHQGEAATLLGVPAAMH
jgi:4'-phosphopantetheinyl transferase